MIAEKADAMKQVRRNNEVTIRDKDVAKKITNRSASKYQLAKHNVTDTKQV